LLTPGQSLFSRTAALRAELDAHGAGYWQVAGDRLEQRVFVPGPEIPEDVAREFAEATRSVSLDRTELGIVKAALSGEVAVSWAARLPDDAGSGGWLRRFGATRSVAVPIRDARGAIEAVFSVGLNDDRLDSQAVAERVRAAVAAWPPLT
jgi:hypothetical protein